MQKKLWNDKFASMSTFPRSHVVLVKQYVINTESARPVIARRGTSATDPHMLGTWSLGLHRFFSISMQNESPAALLFEKTLRRCSSSQAAYAMAASKSFFTIPSYKINILPRLVQLLYLS